MKYVTESRNEREKWFILSDKQGIFLWQSLGRKRIKFAFYILNIIPSRSEVAASWIISSVCLIPLLLYLSCWEEGRKSSNSEGKKKLKNGKEKSCWDELAQQGAADEAKLKS